MFGRGKGGIEQAFIDYTKALADAGQHVYAVADKNAAIIESIPVSHNISLETITQMGQWDLFAVLRLKRLIKKIKPDVIITHGNRATILLLKAAARKVPVIGVCHNYSLKYLLQCDALFSITNDIKNVAVKLGMDKQRIHIIPNMIKAELVKEAREITWHAPVVIGTMGRFVAKKGFDVFIKALSALKQNGVEFKAIIGGGGEEEENLRKLAAEYKLENELNFIGWVQNKEEFFKSIDIFCLPSLHEPFGIVLLEAFANTKSVVTTNSEGPKEIASNERDCLMVPVGDHKLMACAIQRLIENKQFAEQLSLAGFKNVQKNYTDQEVGMKIIRAIGSLKSQ
jgi:glycosyltransferase involved in cell wall biosynthesis